MLSSLEYKDEFKSVNGQRQPHTGAYLLQPRWRRVPALLKPDGGGLEWASTSYPNRAVSCEVCWTLSIFYFLLFLNLRDLFIVCVLPSSWLVSMEAWKGHWIPWNKSCEPYSVGLGTKGLDHLGERHQAFSPALIIWHKFFFKWPSQYQIHYIAQDKPVYYWHSCLWLQSARIITMHHHTWLMPCWDSSSGVCTS